MSRDVVFIGLVQLMTSNIVNSRKGLAVINYEIFYFLFTVSAYDVTSLINPIFGDGTTQLEIQMESSSVALGSAAVRLVSVNQQSDGNVIIGPICKCSNRYRAEWLELDSLVLAVRILCKIWNPLRSRPRCPITTEMDAVLELGDKHLKLVSCQT